MRNFSFNRGILRAYALFLPAALIAALDAPCDAQYSRLYELTRSLDGASPEGGLTVAGSIIYGTNAFGGPQDHFGSIWSFDTVGNTYSKLYEFDRMKDGAHPFGKIALDHGRIYGTNSQGGSNFLGTMWTYDLGANSFSKLHDFGENDGAAPHGGVATSGDVVFGTTNGGGANAAGTLWSYETSTNIQVPRSHSGSHGPGS